MPISALAQHAQELHDGVWLDIVDDGEATTDDDVADVGGRVADVLVAAAPGAEVVGVFFEVLTCSPGAGGRGHLGGIVPIRMSREAGIADI